jgi:glycolate oxidase FAD binding subunit
VNADADQTLELADRVRAASARRTPLRIVGGDTKPGYGRPVDAEPLAVAGHAGIVHYDPAELVITARGGTLLRQINEVLAASGQHLPFEPPAFGAQATLGGAIAAGLAGPSRATHGPVRDYVLGTRVLGGDGRVLRFGGEVMKNVAGYDVSRLMAGSLGILGILLDVSLKVLPLAPAHRTLAFELDAIQALPRMSGAANSNLPISASCWIDGRWYLRIAASPQTLDTTIGRLGGEIVADGDSVWDGVREQTLPAFVHGESLWRVNLPARCLSLPDLPAPCCIEWGGLQRWYAGVEPQRVRAAAAAASGFATWVRGAPHDEEVFTALSPAVLDLHRALKRVFDPAGVLNPGRMYRNL